MANQQMQFANISNQTLVKEPGSIKGESFSIADLSNCWVYILDYTSEVEVSNCTNCHIFVGPVDGPAIFTDSSNCQVIVASQQFQAKTCTSCSFSLYCTTNPAISSCKDIKISPLSLSSHPSLSSLFQSANLDPTLSNSCWNKVYDASQAEEEGAPPNFELIEDGSSGDTWWETQLQASLAAVTTTQESEAAGLGEVEGETPAVEGGGAVIAPQMMDEVYFAAHMPTSNGNVDNGGMSTIDTTIDNFATADTAAAAVSNPTGTAYHPAVEEAQKNTQDRITEQSRKETEQQAETQKKAADFLAKFYEERNKAREARARQLRAEAEANKKPENDGYQGESAWEGALDFIDFNRGGADLSRFKAVLMTSKAKKV